MMLEKYLKYSNEEVARAKIKRRYLQWREKRGIPYRCDNEKCSLHTPNPQWNGCELKLILDHIDGNKFDNRPFMLRLLCPNCDALLPTRGGKNKGRIVKKSESSFHLKMPNDTNNYTYFGSGSIRVAGRAITSIKRGDS